MGTFLFGFVIGANLAWVFTSLRRDGYWREFNARRRGSNPPPPSRKPAPPVGPPEQPALWRDVPIRMDEGTVQRGNGNGGPSTAKPPIKPEPQGGHLIQEGRLWGRYQPRPQSGTPNPPPEAP